MYGFYTDDGNLFVGKEISQDLQRPPKEELFRLFRLAGHDPRQRNIRHGNIRIECKNCGGNCCTSTYRRDAWCVWWCIGYKVVYVVVGGVLHLTLTPSTVVGAATRRNRPTKHQSNQVQRNVAVGAAQAPFVAMHGVSQP